MPLEEKIFITGGSGFVGRNLIRRLVSESYEVIALVRNNNSEKIVSELGANPVRGDLNNTLVMQDAMKECTAIFHLAANTNSYENKDIIYQDNVIGTENVVRSAKLTNVPMLIFVSSDAVLLGNKPLLNVDEKKEKPQKFCGNYSLTKSISEEIVLNANTELLKTIVIRPRLVWGNDDNKFLLSLINKVKKGTFIWIDQGKYLTSTCHVYNLCEGLILAKKYGRGGEIYFLTDGEFIEFRKFVTELLFTQDLIPGKKNLPLWCLRFLANIIVPIWNISKIKKPPPISHNSLFLLGMEITLNDSKARKELSYKPLISINNGLKELISNRERGYRS